MKARWFAYNDNIRAQEVQEFKTFPRIARLFAQARRYSFHEKLGERQRECVCVCLSLPISISQLDCRIFVHKNCYISIEASKKMSPRLDRLTTISQQPSLRDYKPHRHTLSLSSILVSHVDTSSPAPLPAVPLSPSLQDCTVIKGSFRILLYDTPSQKVKELVFSAEEDFDSNMLDILEPHQSEAHEAPPGATHSHDSDPLLCEAVLRSVLVQGNPGLTVQDRQEFTENVKRAFTISDGAFREAKMLAVEATRLRRAEVQAQLHKLHKDKCCWLDPQDFESDSFYQEVKQHEIKELSTMESSLQALPSFATQMQVAILSAEDTSMNGQCIKRKSCYGATGGPQVYCTMKLVPAGRSLADVESKNPDHITRVEAFTGHVEWHDRSPWIFSTSPGDQLCVMMWKKKLPNNSLLKASKETELGLLLRSVSQRRKKITWNGDTLLGRVLIPLNSIEAQALSSSRIRGSLPSKFYTLSDAREEKLPISLELQIYYFCEILLNDAEFDERVLSPPMTNLEAGYSGLVQVAFGMHLEGELQLETTWQKILSCYESYYRVRRETCTLAMLKHVATLFQPEVECLELLTTELKPLCKLAKDGKLIKKEYCLLAEVIALLIRPSINLIEDFQSVIPLDSLQGVIFKLIELLSLLLCWDPNPQEAKAFFKRWVKISCVQRFNKHLMDNCSEGDISSRTFSAAISLVQKDLKTLHVSLKDGVPKELELFETCAQEYYRLVSQYITGIVGSVKISSADFEDLTRELSLLHQELERSSVTLSLLDLRCLLHDHICEMIAAVKPRMIDWIISSLSDEKWEPISQHNSSLVSYSIVDLYFMVNGVVENLTTRLSYFPFGKEYYADLEASLCSVIEAYIQITERMCLQELPDRFDEEHYSFLNHFKSLHGTKSMSLSKTLCVKLNNLHAVLEHQRNLEGMISRKWENYTQCSSDNRDTACGFDIGDRDIQIVCEEDASGEKGVGQCFESLHDLVQRALSNVAGSIIESMQSELTMRLQKLMVTCSAGGKKRLTTEDLELLTTYFDDHLKVLNEWLDPEVFRCLLLEIAGALMFCMEEFALNRDEDPNPMTIQQRDYLEQILDLFYGYFYGDGVGILKAEMDSISGRLREILQCSDLDTNELCMLYWKAWDRFNEDAGVTTATHGKSNDGMRLHVVDFLLLLQQRDDDEARIIVTNQKLLAENKRMQTPFWKEREALLRSHFELSREVVRGVAQYLKTIQTPFPPLNVSYSAFQRMKRW